MIYNDYRGSGLAGEGSSDEVGRTTLEDSVLLHNC